MLWLSYRPWNYIQANILKKLTWSIIWCTSALQGMGGKYIPKVWRYLARTTSNWACLGKRCLPILKRDSLDMYYVWYYFMSACSSDLQWDLKLIYYIYIYIFLYGNTWQWHSVKTQSPSRFPSMLICLWLLGAKSKPSQRFFIHILVDPKKLQHQLLWHLMNYIWNPGLCFAFSLSLIQTFDIEVSSYMGTCYIFCLFRLS